MREQIRTIRRYYRRPRFALIDLCFGLVALFSNPYRTCRKFLQRKKAADIYAYGETPLATLEKIARVCEIGPQDRFLELGSGRGKGCFWMAEFIGCQTHGIEWVPQFVAVAKGLKALFRVSKLSFSREDMEGADLSSYTVVYLYGTCLDDAAVDRLKQKLAELPVGAKVITISYPLPSLELKKSFTVRFPWGVALAYYHLKK